MNAFIEFLREYWFQLVTAIAFIVEIVFIFIKRKPKSIDDFKMALSEVVSFVPEMILDVEEPGKGTEKKLKVLDISKKLVSMRLQRGLTDTEAALIDRDISSKVETVLSTPTKKEKINEK